MYKLAALAGALVAAFALAGVAVADPPSKEVFPGSFSFDDTTTCPGITIHPSNEERDTVTKVVGTVYNVQVPGLGRVLLDAGSIVFDFSTDPPTVLHVSGPHEQFSGDVAAFCSYLA